VAGRDSSNGRYFCQTAWRDVPIARPICSHVYPAPRAAGTAVVMTPGTRSYRGRQPVDALLAATVP
jgi:hypothetical protein